MRYEDYSSIIALSADDHKAAALYFKTIYPMHSSNSVPKELQGHLTFESKGIESLVQNFRQCAPDELQARVIREGQSRLAMQGAGASARAESAREYIEGGVREWGTYEALIRKVLDQGDVNKGKISIPTFCSSTFRESNTSPGADDVVDLILLNLKLIETRNLEWAQILEIKKDPDADAKIRRLRSFIFQNYEGKPVAFITDDIHSRLYEYEEACKKHGLDLVLSSMSILLDSKSLMAVVGLVCLALALGMPLSTVTPALLAEAIREVAKISINIVEKKVDSSGYKRQHPLRYLFEVQKVSR